MKKRVLILILFLLLIAPTLVNAEATINTSFDDEQCILTVSGSQSGHDATVSIFNENDELIGYKTGEINSNNYSIDFVLSYDTDQKINITLSNEGETNEFSKNDISIPSCLLSTTKRYVVSDEFENSISFNEEVGHTYTLLVFDFIGLTDEDLEALNIQKEEYELVLESIINVTKENGTLISYFMIEVRDEHDNVISDGPFKIRIKLTEKMKKYDTFKMIYVDSENNFNTEDPITFTVNGDYLEGTLNHLSEYALVGISNNKNDDVASNPKTSDNVMFYVSLLGVSAIGLVGLGIYNKKKKV